MPAAIQRSAICPSRQRSGVGGVVAADGDHRLDAVGRPEGSGERRWHAQPGDRERLGQALPQAGCGAGVGAVQLAGEGFQVGLGEQRVGLVVGAP
jgi:hypothetical protein